MLLAEMSWEQAKEYLQHDDRIILPLGATEEHGRHLGLGTDFFEAEAIARGTGDRTGLPVAPPLNYGMSHSLLKFPGTLSLRPTTLMAVLEDLFRSLYRHGFRRILVVNGHGGNTASLSSTWHVLAQELPDLRVKTFEWWTDPESYRVVTEMLGPQEGSHASPGETAFMLAVRPEAVHMERLSGRSAPVRPSRELVSLNTFQAIYPDGIMGLDPRAATAQAGSALLAKSIEICAREVESW